MTPFQEVKSASVESFTVRVWMAGDYDDARRFCRHWAAQSGCCWALSPVDYVYSGGEERGLVASRIHYARFPCENPKEDITADALTFAEQLMSYLGQASFSLETPEQTIWVSRRKT